MSYSTEYDGLSPRAAKRPRFSSGGCSWQSWNVEEVCRKLKSHDRSPALVDIFRSNQITGQQLRFLTVDKLMRMGISSMGDCLLIQEFQEHYGCVQTESVPNTKIVNDPIHGHIELHPACVAIINTPQFQRLRFLKQLAMCYFVYPGASHNRFEHSLGVSYLAGQFVRTLRANQKNLGIDDTDILCVEIAGLCHDLGHGPFSHLFDGKFLPTVVGQGFKWKHEMASVALFDHLIKVNGLEDGILKEYGLDKTDMDFIKELIAGPGEEEQSQAWKYKGRHKSKAFLYEIVANKRNNVDVDKWDYLARDCHYLGISNNFDHSRFIKFARVCQVGDEMQICIRDKEIGNLTNMFFTRYTLHKYAYQHKVNCALELMMTHALIKANDYLLFKGKNGKMLKMSECIGDMEAYSQLNDNIMFKILESQNEEDDMIQAKEIVSRILRRDLYKCVGQSKPLKGKDLGKLTTDVIKEQVWDKLKDNEKLSRTDFVIQIAYLDFGMKEDNPVEKMNFYSKFEPDKAFRHSQLEDSRILKPLFFHELLVRAYSCVRDKVKYECISAAFEQWCRDNDFSQISWDRSEGTPTKGGRQNGDLINPKWSAGQMKADMSYN